MDSAQSAPEELVRKLRALEVFGDQPQDVYWKWFVAQSAEHRYEAVVRALLFKEGAPADTMFILLEGEMPCPE